jgi:NADH-quinone oxidoreductase subunit G
MNAEKHMKINGIRVPFTDEKNVLELVRKTGIDLPTFCYHSQLSTYGACRMCIVEDSRGGIFASCSEVPKDGMEIVTNSPRLRKYRKNILRLLLASHCRECTTCDMSNDCVLQDMTSRYGIHDVKYDATGMAYKHWFDIDISSPSIVRDQNKCIYCGDCVRVCSEVQNVGCIDFHGRGYDMEVGPAFSDPIAEPDCVGCGQCAAVCPTAAIVVRDDTKAVWEALFDKNIKVVAQVAPAVRTALGEEFDMDKGEDVMPMINAALRLLGFDEVYDTSFAADLTIMEETAEFLSKLAADEDESRHCEERSDEAIQNGAKYPLFTSCCPAWVKYVENRRPEILPYVSTCKSPQQMFGSVLKEFERVRSDADGRKVYVVSVMPCTAKKGERLRPEFETEGEQDIDAVITTQELANMIYEAGIDFKNLPREAGDLNFGMYSGAGVIFGVSGGVTEAVVRRVSEDKTHAGIESIRRSGVRKHDSVRAIEVPYGDKTLRACIVHGLKAADALIEDIKAGREHFDFVEVMTCPAGCISGGGQPRNFEPGNRTYRSEGLYKSDKMTRISTSDTNPAIDFAYNEVIKDKAHDLLHVPHRS